MKLNLFKKKKVRLISQHIPKTAGTSFRLYLQQQFGENNVMRLDIPILEDVIRVNNEVHEGGELPVSVVYHGHFKCESLKSLVDNYDDIPKITWLRNPVDRVISNYFYLEERLRDELSERKKGLNILSKMQRTLMEYAQAEINRNRISKFIGNMSLDDYDFVGVVEDFEDDLRRLERIMGWEEKQIETVNRTRSKPPVSEDIREAIKALNSDDMVLYNLAMEIKKKGARRIGPCTYLRLVVRHSTMCSQETLAQ